ncbi:MAG: flagellar M-ring protein FliF [Lachnospiraceae bacterium]|nr:flagellar M-ring protein FliF [Lachnospiraceae bacterium]
MADRLKEILNKIVEWWNKFTPKQKTIIVCVVAGVVVAIGIFSYILTRPQYSVVKICESTAIAAEVTEILESNEITNYTSEDALTVYVLEEQLSQARLVLGANDISSEGFGIEDVTSGGFSTTESDKQKRYIVYKEGKMELDLEANDYVKEAHVTLIVPEDDGTLISQNLESSASVVLELSGDMPQEVASSLAHYIATALGNSNTDNVTIIDTVGNLLFSGETQAAGMGNVSTQFAAKQEAEKLVKQEVKSVLLGTNLYDSVEVASNLSLDFSSYKKTDHNYYVADGMSQGYLASENLYSSENESGIGGEPGTGSNDEDGTTYVIENGDGSTSTVTEEERKYLPSEMVTEQTIPAGLIKYDESSVSVTAKKLHMYNEEEVEEQGLLADMTWEEFKAANGEQIKLEVDADMYSIVQTATGISTENISIVAYEVPVFLDKEGPNVQATDVVQILLIIAILAVLAFVVIRSMRSQKEEDTEEELAVENLLQSTPDTEIENIDLDSKSEARKMIEKCVDENPEAVANLLRNWLTEDWG